MGTTDKGMTHYALHDRALPAFALNRHTRYNPPHANTRAFENTLLDDRWQPVHQSTDYLPQTLIIGRRPQRGQGLTESLNTNT